MTHNFVTTHISFSTDDAVPPNDLPVGHLIDDSDLAKMAKASTTPQVDSVCGEDFFLIVAAGTTYNAETGSKSWLVELMDTGGETFILRGAAPVSEDLLVTPSRRPWKM